MQKGFSVTRSFQVTEKIYSGFIEIFNDKNPLHADESFAREKGFHSKVMHGNILGGFLSYFVGELLPMKNVIIHSQEIKFSKPVYLNDRLNFSAEADEVYDSVNAVVFKFKFENEAKEKVASGKIQIGLI